MVNCVVKAYFIVSCEVMIPSFKNCISKGFNKIFILSAFFILAFGLVQAQEQLQISIVNQYDGKIQGLTINGQTPTPLPDGLFVITGKPGDSILIKATDHADQIISFEQLKGNKVVQLDKKFTWTDLINPTFYIVFGGLWLFLFIVFAETGLLAGFFLPGDSLLFIAGIYSYELFTHGLGINLHSDFLHLLILSLMVVAAGVLGNEVGYWFGKKSGPALYQRKDGFLFKQKYLQKAHDFYEENGAGTIVIARFLPIIRTFAPIVAGIVKMNKKKFTFYNIIGCFAWSFTMLFAGHYLYKIILDKFNFNLKEHLEIIIIGIVVITTFPVIMKLFFSKKKPIAPTGAEEL